MNFAQRNIPAKNFVAFLCVHFIRLIGVFACFGMVYPVRNGLFRKSLDNIYRFFKRAESVTEFVALFVVNAKADKFDAHSIFDVKNNLSNESRISLR